MAANPYLPSYAQIAPGMVQPVPIGIQPIQGGPQLGSQVLPTIPAPQFADLSNLQDQVARFAPGAPDTSPTTLAGGIARMLGGWAQGWAESRAKEKLQQGKQDNAKLLADLLKNGGLSSPDTAISMISSPDEAMQNFGLKLLESQQPTGHVNMMTPQERANLGIPQSAPPSYWNDKGDPAYLSQPDQQSKPPAHRQIIRGGTYVEQDWDGTKWIDTPNAGGTRWNPNSAVQSQPTIPTTPFQN